MKRIEKKRILVTGAGGFIGSHLTTEITKRGWDLISFEKNRHSIFDKEVLRELLPGIDVVVHLAGVSDPQNPDVIHVNVCGTKTLLDVISEISPGALFIYSSSFAVYRIPKAGEVIDENYKTSPRNNYGLSKLMAEEVIKAYEDSRAIKSLIFRFSNVYGSGMKPGKHSVVANFIEQIVNNKPVEINGDGLQTRDFIYIDDVVMALILGILKGAKVSGSIINICSGEETTIKNLLEIIQKESGFSSKIKYTGENLSGEGFWKGDWSLAKKLLGWKPETKLESGIKKILKKDR